jgi:hypothetical protein
MSCLEFGDAPCVPVDPFTRSDVHHTHEGRLGFWLFESEVPEGYNRLRALIAAELHRYPRDARGPDAKNISAAIKDSRYGWRDVYRELMSMDSEHLVRVSMVRSAKHWGLTEKGRRMT